MPTLAWGAVGKISAQQHDIGSITRNKEVLKADLNATIEMLDALRTTQGTLEITFKDDTIVQMTESARMTVDDFVYDPKNKDAGKLAIKIAAGTARYASGQIAKDYKENVLKEESDVDVALNLEAESKIGK